MCVCVCVRMCTRNVRRVYGEGEEDASGYPYRHRRCPHMSFCSVFVPRARPYDGAVYAPHTRPRFTPTNPSLTAPPTVKTSIPVAVTHTRVIRRLLLPLSSFCVSRACAVYTHVDVTDSVCFLLCLYPKIPPEKEGYDFYAHTRFPACSRLAANALIKEIIFPFSRHFFRAFYKKNL